MKKFEEELFSKVPCKFGLNTEGEYKQSILIKHFKDWISPEDHQAEIEKIELQNLKYREEIERMQKSLRKKNKAIKELNGAIKKSKARLKAWHSDEEFQLLLRDRDTLKQGNDNLFKNHLELVEENDELKAKLEKQQPEIPEFVAEYIERCKRSDCGLIWAVRPDRDANENSEKIYDWLYPNGVRLSDGTFPEPFEPDNLVRPDKDNHIKFVRAWLDGYTVNEKRFYLKHIDFCKRDKDYDWYMIKHSDGPLNHLHVEKGLLPLTIDTHFTQEEIDNINTGSYEQIEVAE